MRACINRANVISFSWHCFILLVCFFLFLLFYFLSVMCLLVYHTLRLWVCFQRSITTDNELITNVKYFRASCVCPYIDVAESIYIGSTFDFRTQTAGIRTTTRKNCTKYNINDLNIRG